VINESLRRPESIENAAKAEPDEKGIVSLERTLRKVTAWYGGYALSAWYSLPRGPECSASAARTVVAVTAVAQGGEDVRERKAS